MRVSRGAPGLVVTAALTLLPLLTAPTNLAAQSRPAAAQSTGGSCFRGRPLPRCDSFWLTEFGFGWRVVESDAVPEDRESWLYSAEIGHMWNTSETRALGGTIFADFSDDATRLGLRPRGRLWLGGGTSAELAPFVVLVTNDDRYPDVAPGGGAVASLNVMDYGALTLQADVLRLSSTAGETGAETSIHAGVRAGSWAGMVGAVGISAAVVIAVATAF